MTDTERPSATAHRDVNEKLSIRLEIDPVITRAESIIIGVDRDLPEHPGLARISRCVAQVARDAKAVSRSLKHPIGFHRLPAAFLIFSILLLATWAYWQFIHTSKLHVAVSERDAVQLRNTLGRRVQIVPETTVGSRESIERLERGEVDLAFIQGGVTFPDSLPSMELDTKEVVLFFTRDSSMRLSQISKILTSAEGQGSHSVAQIFTRVWGISESVEFVHEWRIFTDDMNYQIPNDVDAVFVVGDPMSTKLEGTASRLLASGFQLTAPDIGAMSLRLDFLSDYKIPAGFLEPGPHLPDNSVPSYAVATYLVARAGLTSQQMAFARQMSHPDPGFPEVIEPTLHAAGEFAQGVESMLGIVVYLGLAFLGLLGLDAFAYRKRFHDLNSLVSLISMHQSSKDVMTGTPEERAHSVSYLAVCSDLLGIIAVVTGYYAQENSSLLYNRLSDIIHERCSGLKINIQLKILHATIQLPNADQRGDEATRLSLPAEQEDLTAEQEDLPAEQEGLAAEH